MSRIQRIAASTVAAGMLFLAAPGIAADQIPDPVGQFAGALGDKAREAFLRLTPAKQNEIARSCPTPACVRSVGALHAQGSRFARRAHRCLGDGACSAALARLGRNRPSIYDTAEINGMPASVWKLVRKCGTGESCVHGVLAAARKDRKVFYKAALDESLVLSAMLSIRIGATDHVVVLAGMVSAIGAGRARDIVALSI